MVAHPAREYCTYTRCYYICQSLCLILFYDQSENVWRMAGERGIQCHMSRDGLHTGTKCKSFWHYQHFDWLIMFQPRRKVSASHYSSSLKIIRSHLICSNSTCLQNPPFWKFLGSQEVPGVDRKQLCWCYLAETFFQKALHIVGSFRFGLREIFFFENPLRQY